MNKQRSKWLICTLLIFVLVITACSGGNKGNNNELNTTKQPTGQNVDDEQGKAAEEIDPYRLPNPVEFTTFKHIGAEAKLPTGDTVENNQYSRYSEEKTNITVKIEWYASGNDYEQKSKLYIGSGDIPDVLLVDEQTFRTLALAGQLEDLTSVYEQYVAPLTEELFASTNNLALEKATINGQLMGFPNIAVQADAASMLFVRQDWLDELKLDGPRTVEDVRTIAKAFVDNNMAGNRTIGLTGSNNALKAPGKAGRHDFKGLFAAFNAYPSNWVKDNNGQIVYGSILPETKEALGFLRAMYLDGLIDEEFALRKELDQPVIAGNAGMFFGPWWSGGVLRDTYANIPDANFGIYMIEDDKGVINNLKLPVSQRYIVVRKGYEHPEAAIVYANNFIRAERRAEPDSLLLDHSISTEFWPIGNATYDYADAVERKSDTLADALAGKIQPEDLNSEMKQLYDFAMADQAAPREDLVGWARFFGYTEPAEMLKKPMKDVFNEYTTTTKTMERKWANLEKIEEEMFYQIVMGKRPLDDFDTFVKDWKEQGGDEITQEIQDELN